MLHRTLLVIILTLFFLPLLLYFLITWECASKDEGDLDVEFFFFFLNPWEAQWPVSEVKKGLVSGGWGIEPCILPREATCFNRGAKGATFGRGILVSSWIIGCQKCLLAMYFLFDTHLLPFWRHGRPGLGTTFLLSSYFWHGLKLHPHTRGAVNGKIRWLWTPILVALTFSHFNCFFFLSSSSLQVPHLQFNCSLTCFIVNDASTSLAGQWSKSC